MCVCKEFVFQLTQDNTHTHTQKLIIKRGKERGEKQMADLKNLVNHPHAISRAGQLLRITCMALSWPKLKLVHAI